MTISKLPKTLYLEEKVEVVFEKVKVMEGQFFNIDMSNYANNRDPLFKIDLCHFGGISDLEGGVGASDHMVRLKVRKRYLKEHLDSFTDVIFLDNKSTKGLQ